VTRGWLTGLPDKLKEGILFSALLVGNVALFLYRRHV
jgi:hypothetical protein